MERKFGSLMLRLCLRDDNKVQGGEMRSRCMNAKCNTPFTGS